MSPMKGRTKDTLISVLVQYIALAVLLCQGLLLVPLYLRYIDVALYGAWLATGQAFSWLALVDPGVNDVMKQRLATVIGRRDTGSVGVIFGTGLLLGGLFILGQVALGIVLTNVLTGHFALEPENVHSLRTAFIIGIVANAVNAVAFVFGSALQAIQQQALQSIIYTIGSIVYLVALLVFLVKGMGISSLPLGLLVRGCIYVTGSSAALYFNWRKMGFPRCVFRLDEARRILGVSVTSGVSRIASVFQQNTDLFVAGYILGPSSVVILSLTGKCYEFLRGILEKFAHAIVSPLAHYAADRGNAETGGLVWTLVEAVGCWTWFMMGVGIAVNGLFVRLWFKGDMFGGLPLSTALAVQGGMTTLSTFVSFSLFALGNIVRPAKINMVQSLIKIIFSLALIKTCGIIGLPLAGVISLGLMTAYFMWEEVPRALGTKKQHTPGFYGRCCLSFVICTSVGMLVAANNKVAGWRGVILSAGLFFFSMFPVMLFINPWPLRVAQDLTSTWPFILKFRLAKHV